MNNRIMAICPTVERLDLVRQLLHSYIQTWEEHLKATPPMEVDFSDPLPLPRPLEGWAPTADEVKGSLPPITFFVSGNDDATEGWLKNQVEQGLPISVIRSQEIVPYAQAVNAAAKLGNIEADFLLLLNNDLIIQLGFWAALDEMIGLGYEVIGSKLLYPNGTIQHFGKMFTLDYYPFHVLRYQPGDHPMSQRPRPFPDVTFACVAIKKAIWDDLGGLDEQYTNGFEDDDFCLSARERGAQIGVHPGMLATHLEAQSTGIDTGNKEAMWQRFHAKWIATDRIIWPLGVFPQWRQS